MKQVLVIFLIIISYSTFSCTVFKVNTNEGLYIGSNEDWLKMNSSVRIWFTPRTENRNAVSYFGFEIHHGWAQSAYNEYGLFYDSADTPPTIVGYDSSKTTLAADMLRRTMEECKNVDEAIVFMSKYNWSAKPTNLRGHYLLADKSGKSVIIEWKDEKIQIIEDSTDFQLMTNFLIAQKEKSPSCRRYKKCQKAYLNNSINSKEDITSVLKSVEQNNLGSTIVSKIYNISTGMLYLRFPKLKDSTITINLIEGFNDTIYYITLPSTNTRKSFKQTKLFDLNDTLYFDENWVVTDNVKKSKYFRITKLISFSDSTKVEVCDYYISGNLQMNATYNSIAEMVLSLPNGKSIWYNKNGTIRTEGTYLNGRKHGLWIFHDDFGNIIQQIEFNEDFIVEIFK